MENVIQYGIGMDYLPKWGIKEALREIFQNYIDYGEYTILVIGLENDKVRVVIHNDYKPNELEFLRVGNSYKPNAESIGKHGEGLKLAFLIFKRLNLSLDIYSNKYHIYPRELDTILGKTLGIAYKEIEGEPYFETVFECSRIDYELFISSIITDADILFTDNYHGDIVDRKKGDIYSGRLFVCNLPNISKAYNIKPSQLPLDRDRSLPRSWDVSYHCSKLNEKYQHWKHEDLEYSDTDYIEHVPDNIAKEYGLITVKKNIEFIHKVTNSILKKDNISKQLKQNPIFSKKINDRRLIVANKKIKAKNKSILKLLFNLRKKLVDGDLLEDINIIINKVKGKL